MRKMEQQEKKRRARRSFTDEFKAGAVRLVLDEGKTAAEVARDLDLHSSVVGTWVKPARADRTKGRTGLHRELGDNAVNVGIRHVTRLRSDLDLRARVRRRYKHTTVSDHDQPIAPNLLEQKFEATEPNQRWVGDTTELLVGEHGAKL